MMVSVLYSLFTHADLRGGKDRAAAGSRTRPDMHNCLCVCLLCVVCVVRVATKPASHSTRAAATTRIRKSTHNRPATVTELESIEDKRDTNEHSLYLRHPPSLSFSPACFLALPPGFLFGKQLLHSIRQHPPQFSWCVCECVCVVCGVTLCVCVCVCVSDSDGTQRSL